MNKQIIITLCSLAVSILIMTFVMITNIQVEAQVESTDRFFQKDYCLVEKTLFDDVTYTEPNDFLSYDISECPTVNIIIHRWNELSTGEKTLITVRLNAQGYSDITNQVLSQ